jgi:hypothetical protein
MWQGSAGSLSWWQERGNEVPLLPKPEVRGCIAFASSGAPNVEIATSAVEACKRDEDVWGAAKGGDTGERQLAVKGRGDHSDKAVGLEVGLASRLSSSRPPLSLLGRAASSGECEWGHSGTPHILLTVFKERPRNWPRSGWISVGKARQGKARRGEARRGEARRGELRK